MTAALGTAFAWACAQHASSPSSTGSAAKRRVPLTLTINIANTQWNSALPEDFLLTVTGGGFPASVTIAGTADPQQISIEAGAAYKVTVSGPDGYLETLTPDCASDNPDGPATCAIVEKEAPFGCDPALWDPVYRKDRLRVLSACEIAVVTIAVSNLEPDGDADILADPDDRFRRLLGPGNDREASGKMVIEIPCQGAVSQADAMGTCNGFKGTRLSPRLAVGERVVAAAHWVEDRNHGMQRELHGAAIRRLPR
jgi:hypothetical protein